MGRVQRACDVRRATCDARERAARHVARVREHAARHVARGTRHVAQRTWHLDRCTLHVTAATAAVSLFFLLSASPSAAPIIDRVMAVVSGSIVTLSDVEAAMAVGIINPGKGQDPLGAALNELINRTLMLIEVDRYAPPDPSPEQIEARVRDLRARLGTADAARQLAEYGLSDGALRSLARDDLRLGTYLDQRFVAMDPVTDVDVERYYREHQAEFRRDGIVQPLADVRQEVIDRFIAARRAQLITEWVQGLRSRADVTILYLAQSSRSEVQSTIELPTLDFRRPQCPTACRIISLRLKPACATAGAMMLRRRK